MISNDASGFSRTDDEKTAHRSGGGAQKGKSCVSAVCVIDRSVVFPLCLDS